jgi:hypothetical protein
LIFSSRSLVVGAPHYSVKQQEAALM